jgi:hypothetical protein
MKTACRLVLLCAILAPACEISDADRCPDGYVYDAERRFCVVDPGGDGDTDADSDADSDADTDPDGGPPSGLGEACASQEECEGYDADYCAINPMTSVGYCTIQDCEMGACPDGYQCCDCTSSGVLPPGVACLTDSDATQASSVLGGCTCQ